MRINGPTIMVCGISGVGKTYLIRQVKQAVPAALTWSAGEIIGEARLISDPEQLRRLPTDGIEQSQALLINGYRSRRVSFPDALVMLDGHSVIDTDGGYFEISADVIGALAPVALVHIHDDVSKILERRQRDARTRPHRSISDLMEYQKRSLHQCDVLRQALGVPLFTVRSGEVDRLLVAVRSVTEVWAMGSQ